MTLSDLIATIRWADVKAALIWGYPDAEASIDDYRRVFESLRKLDPIPSNMRIIVRKTLPEGPEGAPVYEVSGRDGSLNRDQRDFPSLGPSADSAYANAETDFSLSLESWERWLGMAIDPATLAVYAPAQIVAHCVWEMTFYGLEPSQIEEVREEIKRRAEELDSMSEEERKARCIPWEQVRKELRRRFGRQPTEGQFSRRDDRE